ncbi:hypothetical protein [Devosia naphthalenivorans]|uniref:hypothetical protein n=1 Tax=Devosia naphthalenivorans TaxID=2082392 RepID=UPI0013B068DE|nr:hypothetical protein [Devosia naphthalenivorans]
MTEFDSLKIKCREAALAELRFVPIDTNKVELNIVEAVIRGLEATVPAEEHVSIRWMGAMLEARPDLFTLESDGESIRSMCREAVLDLIMVELEGEINEFARDLGFFSPPGFAP